jgi:hypothetical protein
MMDNEMAMISAWSYGLTGLLAAFLALYLASGWKVGGRSRAMFLAVSLCALWGLLGMAFALTQNVLFPRWQYARRFLALRRLVSVPDPADETGVG